MDSPMNKTSVRCGYVGTKERGKRRGMAVPTGTGEIDGEYP